MNARRTRAPGFTLLEITITLAILGVVMTLVYGVFTQTITAKNHTEEVGEQFTSARSALARITQDLLNARQGAAAALPAGQRNANDPPAQPQSRPVATPTPSNSRVYLPQLGLFLGRARSEHRVPLDDLAFSATVRRPTALTYGATDVGIVHYFLAPISDDARDRLGLFRETVFSLSGEGFDPDRPNAATTTLVLPDVVALDFRFFNGKEWGEEWDSTNPRDFAVAPLAVEIELAVASPGATPETYRTAVDLPMLLKNRATELARPGQGRGQ